ncbi:YD repeat (two copies) [Solimicrobium silvestre]|uniref:YD repeat (Two copies) n=1 Tax=Solimicrobium silvestre TaxID=2099400 RepID=A0A2S9GYA8_9BURK|nr:YD repeat (two copies) [Solimicrobium silvestre]
MKRFILFILLSFFMFSSFAQRGAASVATATVYNPVSYNINGVNVPASYGSFIADCSPDPKTTFGSPFTTITITEHTPTVTEYWCSSSYGFYAFLDVMQTCPPSSGTIFDTTNSSCICPSTGSTTSFNDYYSDVQKCVLTNQVPAPPRAKPINSGCPVCDKAKSVGDPINVGTGNSYQTQTDLAVVAPFSGLSISRTYNSLPTNPDASTIRSFGTRWTQPYDARVTPIGWETPPNMVTSTIPVICWQRTDTGYIWCEYPKVPVWQVVTVTRGDGKGLYFTAPAATAGSQIWTADQGVTGQLTSTVASDGITPTSFTFTDTDNHTETFDGNGLLLKLTAQSGSTQQLTYSTGTTNDSSVSRYPATAPICPHVQAGAAVASGTLLCVTDNWGRQLQFEHDQPGVNESVGRITLAIDPNNHVTQYGYDGPSAGCMTVNGQQTYACLASNLTSITYPDGKTKTLYYNEAAQINGGTVCPGSAPVGNGFGYLLNTLTGIVDENGTRSVSWTFDCNGIATSSQLGAGVDSYQIAVGAADVNGNSTSVVTSPLGTQTTYGFTAVNGLVVGNAVAQPAGSGSATATASSTFDANGNLTSHTDFNGHITNYTYDANRNLELIRTEAMGTTQARTITTSWNPTYRLPAQVAEPLRMTTYTYDTNGNLLTKTQQATTDVNGVQGVSATVTGTPRKWTYTYNSVGQVLTITGPRTDVTDLTQFAYDTYGNLSSVTNAAGQVTTLSNYDLNGHVGSITDPNGLTTTYAYSPRGWLTSQSRGSEVTSYNYDGAGQLLSVTFPNQAKLTYTYDTAHRLTNIADNLGNTVNYTLDAMGNRTLEQVNDTSGNLARQISRVVDALNRLQQITGAQ